MACGHPCPVDSRHGVPASILLVCIMDQEANPSSIVMEQAEKWRCFMSKCFEGGGEKSESVYMLRSWESPRTILVGHCKPLRHKHCICVGATSDSHLGTMQVCSPTVHISVLKLCFSMGPLLLLAFRASGHSSPSVPSKQGSQHQAWPARGLVPPVSHTRGWSSFPACCF